MQRKHLKKGMLVILLTVAVVAAGLYYKFIYRPVPEDVIEIGAIKFRPEMAPEYLVNFVEEMLENLSEPQTKNYHYFIRWIEPNHLPVPPYPHEILIATLKYQYSENAENVKRQIISKIEGTEEVSLNIWDHEVFLARGDFIPYRLISTVAVTKINTVTHVVCLAVSIPGEDLKILVDLFAKGIITS